MKKEYAAFLARKEISALPNGIDPKLMPAAMKPHQKDATAFAVKRGRSGLFLDTGLGKTLCQLEWCRQVSHRALILTPLAVAKQIEREATRFGYEARVIKEQSEASDGINICNYDRLSKLDPDIFDAISLDESAILKSFTGKTSRALRETFAKHRFRLAASATPAPNDYMEIGTHVDFLSIMSNVEMLSRFFVNDTSTASQQWRLKGHAERSFWDWMASWACMAESPADFGYDDTEYRLPPYKIIKHRIDGTMPIIRDGLFASEISATNIHKIKQATTDSRADRIAELVCTDKDPWIVWCDLNAEADALTVRIPDSIEVRGSDSIEKKEENLDAFSSGQARVIVTKPDIAGHGLNWQHCARMAFVGRSFSYETWYQAVRRSWRYGQKRELQIHLAVAEGEDQIGRVIDRKGADHVRMKAQMVAAMRRALGKDVATKIPYRPTQKGAIPSWLKTSAA